MSDVVSITELELAMRKLAHQVKLDTIEACAKVIEPKGPRPCDCEPLRCYCQNYDDAQAVAAWDADKAAADMIRRLALPPQEQS